jgi:hypothetical protein
MELAGTAIPPQAAEDGFVHDILERQLPLGHCLLDQSFSLRGESNRRAHVGIIASSHVML